MGKIFFRPCDMSLQNFECGQQLYTSSSSSSSSSSSPLPSTSFVVVIVIIIIIVVVVVFLIAIIIITTCIIMNSHVEIIQKTTTKHHSNPEPPKSIRWLECLQYVLTAYEISSRYFWQKYGQITKITRRGNSPLSSFISSAGKCQG